MLTIYNSLTRKKEKFEPLQAGKVGMYVCGMTVYDYCHIGHGRMMVAFDAIRRWLIASGYQVTFVRNITDIDDKIIQRALKNAESMSALTERFIGYMHEDFAALGTLQPDHEPRATQYVPQMLTIIDKLMERGFAYQTRNADGSPGDVNYAVRRFPGYGKLSGKSLDDLRAGERVDVDRSKEDPLDFVLWKSAKADEPEEAKWTSKYGPGRPGWHIECSAMSTSLLGNTIDIHAGGIDLQFPHHENEIAQSEAANGCCFVRYWMHNGHVRVDNEKMSKSLDNFFTIRDVLKHYDGEVIRFFLLRSHYRSPINYSSSLVEDARLGLLRLYTAVAGAGSEQLEGASVDWNQPSGQAFAEAMNDDFNTPIACSVLFDLATEVNRTRNPSLRKQLVSLARILGLLTRSPEAAVKSGLRPQATASGLSDQAIQALIDERAAAKKSRDFARADEIRKQLSEAGIVLEDGAQGTTWRRG